MENPDYLQRAGRYHSLQPQDVKIKEFLGEGTDGAVWSTNRNTAVKVFKYERGYYNERDSYQQLARFGVTKEIEALESLQIYYLDPSPYNIVFPE